MEKKTRSDGEVLVDEINHFQILPRGQGMIERQIVAIKVGKSDSQSRKGKRKERV